MKIISLFVTALLFSSISVAQDYSHIEGFQFLGTIPIPDNHSANPGELSRNGKSFYLSVKDTSNNYRLLRYTRKKAGSLFSNSKQLKGALDIDTLRPSQPSTSANEKILIITHNDGSGWDGNDLYECKRKNKKKDPYALKPISALNTSRSEAYPWVSANGLRLYYTGNDELMMSSRNSTSDEFGPGQILKFSSDINYDILSCWLPNDESAIYFVANNTIYMAKAQSTGLFGEVTVYADAFDEEDFIAGLSFTNDMSELFLYSSGDETRILHFKVGQ